MRVRIRILVRDHRQSRLSSKTQQQHRQKHHQPQQKPVTRMGRWPERRPTPPSPSNTNKQHVRNIYTLTDRHTDTDTQFWRTIRARWVVKIQNAVRARTPIVCTSMLLLLAWLRSGEAFKCVARWNDGVVVVVVGFFFYIRRHIRTTRCRQPNGDHHQQHRHHHHRTPPNTIDHRGER